MTKHETAMAMWNDEVAFGLARARGEQECPDCGMYARQGQACGTCNGTGRNPGEEYRPLGWRAAGASGDVREALGVLADLAADAQVAREAQVAGTPRLDVAPDAALPLLAELAELGPMVARAAEVCAALATVLAPFEVNDPRRLQAESHAAAE